MALKLRSNYCYGCDLKNILICESKWPNFLSHMSGIASYTNKFVKMLKASKILLYRKTIPNLRVTQSMQLNWVEVLTIDLI